MRAVGSPLSPNTPPSNPTAVTETRSPGPRPLPAQAPPPPLIPPAGGFRPELNASTRDLPSTLAHALHAIERCALPTRDVARDVVGAVHELARTLGARCRPHDLARTLGADPSAPVRDLADALSTVAKREARWRPLHTVPTVTARLQAAWWLSGGEPELFAPLARGIVGDLLAALVPAGTPLDAALTQVFGDRPADPKLLRITQAIDDGEVAASLDRLAAGSREPHVVRAQQRALAEEVLRGVGHESRGDLLARLPTFNVRDPMLTGVRAVAEQLLAQDGLAPSGPSTAPTAGGAVIVLHADGKPHAVMKIFGSEDEFFLELAALERWRRTGTPDLHTYEPLALLQVDLPHARRAPAMLMSVAPGHDALAAIHAVQAASDPVTHAAALTRACADLHAIGAAMARFHEATQGPTDTGKGMRLLADVWRLMDDLNVGLSMAGLPPDELAALRDRVIAQVTKLGQVDLGACHVHGDAHPGNYFVDERGTVTAIDLGAGNWYADGDAPAACPSVDFGRAFESIVTRCLHLDPHDIDALQFAFIAGYCPDAAQVPEVVRVAHLRALLLDGTVLRLLAKQLARSRTEGDLARTSQLENELAIMVERVRHNLRVVEGG